MPGDGLDDRVVHHVRKRQIGQEHAECNGDQQQGLEALDDRQIQQQAGDSEHHEDSIVGQADKPGGFAELQ